MLRVLAVRRRLVRRHVPKAAQSLARLLHRSQSGERREETRELQKSGESLHSTGRKGSWEEEARQCEGRGGSHSARARTALGWLRKPLSLSYLGAHGPSAVPSEEKVEVGQRRRSERQRAQARRLPVVRTHSLVAHRGLLRREAHALRVRHPHVCQGRGRRLLLLLKAGRRAFAAAGPEAAVPAASPLEQGEEPASIVVLEARRDASHDSPRERQAPLLIVFSRAHVIVRACASERERREEAAAAGAAPERRRRRRP